LAARPSADFADEPFAAATVSRLAEHGLSPMQVLIAAAENLGLAHDLSRLAVGTLADLNLTDGDSVADVAATGQSLLVVEHGVVHRDELATTGLRC
jgi:imidazolonepropionase-like amidohydrolase